MEGFTFEISYLYLEKENSISIDFAPSKIPKILLYPTIMLLVLDYILMNIRLPQPEFLTKIYKCRLILQLLLVLPNKSPLLILPQPTNTLNMPGHIDFRVQELLRPNHHYEA